MRLLLICITVGGSLFSVAAALVFYLSAEKQKLFKQKIPGKVGVISGFVLLFLSWLVFRQYFGPATTIYIVGVWQMLLLSLLPALVGYLKRKKA